MYGQYWPMYVMYVCKTSNVCVDAEPVWVWVELGLGWGWCRTCLPSTSAAPCADHSYISSRIANISVLLDFLIPSCCIGLVLFVVFLLPALALSTLPSALPPSTVPARNFYSLSRFYSLAGRSALSLAAFCGVWVRDGQAQRQSSVAGAAGGRCSDDYGKVAGVQVLSTCGGHAVVVVATAGTGAGSAALLLPLLLPLYYRCCYRCCYRCSFRCLCWCWCWCRYLFWGSRRWGGWLLLYSSPPPPLLLLDQTPHHLGQPVLGLGLGLGLGG
jgi:hypothetical protein